MNAEEKKPEWMAQMLAWMTEWMAQADKTEAAQGQLIIITIISPPSSSQSSSSPSSS